MTLTKVAEWPCPGCTRPTSTGKCSYCAVSLLYLSEPGVRGYNALHYFSEHYSKRAARIAKGESVLSPLDAEKMQRAMQAPNFSAMYQQWQGMVMIEELLETCSSLHSALAAKQGEIDALEIELDVFRGGETEGPKSPDGSEDQIDPEQAQNRTGVPLSEDQGVSPDPATQEAQREDPGSLFLLTEDEA